MKDRLIDSIKNKSEDETDKEIAQAVTKIENQKRLSSQEFLKVHEKLWQKGPSIKYQNPSAEERKKQVINQEPNLF